MKKNKLVQKLMTKISCKFGRTGLVLKKYRPEIALAGGIIGIGGTIVLACSETLKADQVIDRHHERLDRIQESVEIIQNGEVEDITYDAKDVGRDKFISYCMTARDFAKLYAPAVVLGTLSIGLILWSHGLMRKRYLGVVAAYNGLSEAFKMYRDRVRSEEGEDADRHYMFGTERHEEIREIVDENGKKKKEKEIVETIPENADHSEFTRLWAPGETSAYMENTNNSLMFLRAQCKIANNILQTRGHITLNEVLDGLGFKQTPVGAVTGWVKGNKDDYVDFGIYDDTNPAVRSFIDGKSNVVPLEFNVDGVILDLI